MQNQESGQDKEVGAAILRSRSEKASVLGGREVGGVSCQEEAGNVGVGPPRVSQVSCGAGRALCPRKPSTEGCEQGDMNPLCLEDTQTDERPCRLLTSQVVPTSFWLC